MTRPLLKIVALLCALALNGCLVHRASRFEHPDDAGWVVLERLNLQRSGAMGKIHEVKPPADTVYSKIRLRGFLREIEVKGFWVWLPGGEEVGGKRPESLPIKGAKTYALAEPTTIERIDIDAYAHGRGSGSGVLVVLGKLAGT